MKTKEQAQALRAKAQAIYDTQDYTLAQAAEALQLTYEASVIERELGIPAQTTRKPPSIHQHVPIAITHEDMQDITIHPKHGALRKLPNQLSFNL